MQAFSTPWGPLVAPEIPTGTDVTTPFETGVQIAQRNNAMMRAYENQVALNQLRWERFGLAQQGLEQRIQAEQDRNERLTNQYQTSNYWRDLAAQTRDRNLDLRESHQEDLAEGQQGAAQAPLDVKAQGITPDKPEFMPSVYEALNANNAWKNETAYKAAVTAAEAQQRFAADRMLRELKANTQAFYDKVNTQVYGGAFPGKPPMGPVVSPNSYADQTVSDAGWNPLTWGNTKPTGNKKVDITDATGKVIKSYYPATDTLMNLNKDWQALQKKSQDFYNISSAASPPPDPMRDQAIQIQNDPNASPAARAAAQQYLNPNPALNPNSP